MRTARLIWVLVCFLANIEGWATETELATNPQPLPVTLLRSSCKCGQCYVAETLNFRIQWCSSAIQLRELAETCERLKSRTQLMWLGTSKTWEARCEIVVHPTVVAYSRILGPGSERTSGCATIRLNQGRVAVRRIDLRADAADWLSESLPHELTHVVMSERFTARQMPAWADEGIAMLAESPEKLQRRLHELQGLIAANRTLRLSELVSLNNGPTSEGFAAFYGQSVTFTGLLLELGTPEQLIRFAEQGQRDGHDKALRDIYGIESWTDLEAKWRTYAVSPRLRLLARHTLPEPKSDGLVTLTPKKSGVVTD